MVFCELAGFRARFKIGKAIIRHIFYKLETGNAKRSLLPKLSLKG